MGLVFFFILFARRYSQLLDPQVWDEEGRIITEIVAHGPLAFAIPLNGYLVLLPRMISFVSLLFPLAWYPSVAVVLTWAAIIAILLAIALVPSRLRYTPLLAVTALLVPSNPEVFGLPLYTFWWTIPLLYAAYFWTTEQRILVPRIAAIVLAGLSAPAIVPVAPLFILRAALRRRADDIAAGLAATVCALIQGIFIMHEGGSQGHLSLAAIPVILQKLVGGFLIFNFMPSGQLRDTLTLIFGIITVIFIVVAIWSEPAVRPALFVLGYLWLSAVALTAVRMDVAVIDQVGAGPRYYFLPFLLESWILVQIAAFARNRPIRASAALCLIVATFNTLPALSRTHADLAWNTSIAICGSAPPTGLTAIPIQTDGRADPHWSMWLSGFECHRLGRFGLLGLAFKRPAAPASPNGVHR